MKKRQVWRYTCEFCKKSNCSAHHMRRHEESCTANPARNCKFCGVCNGALLPELIAITQQCAEDNIEPLREAANGCPACMLAAIRQSGKQRPYESEDDRGFSFAFDFKKEKESWWHDEKHAREEMHPY